MPPAEEANTAAAEGTSFSDFRVVRALNRTGDVVVAIDRALDRSVVLRLCPEDRAAASAFVDVARVLSRVSHPALCTVHRLVDEAERRFVVMDYAGGTTLHELHGVLSDDQLLSMARSLAGALVALHAEGLTHGEVAADNVVLSAQGGAVLVGMRSCRPSTSEAARAADVAALCTLLTAHAEPELRARLAHSIRAQGLTATELLHALDALAGGDGRPTDAANPYRGLEPFDVGDASQFFGRELAVQESIERLRGQPWLVVTGPPGCGKTSFVRAGLASCVARGDLGERARWHIAAVAHSARMVDALVDALAPAIGRDAAGLAQALRAEPFLAARLARERSDRGLLVLVDPLDVLLPDPREREDARVARDILRAFGVLSPGVRVVFTLRSSNLQHLASLGDLGRQLLRSVQPLPMLRETELRAVVTGPARSRGVELESSTIDALVAEVGGSAEALPMLSFAMAELWKSRDVEQRVLPRAALASAGGAASILAKHGEMVWASLAAEERREARRALAMLGQHAEAGGAGTTRDHLLATGEPRACGAALDALARARLVVVDDSCKLAHPGLVRAWPRLRGWMDELSSARAASLRLGAAAREWERLGRRPDELWSQRQLRDARTDGALEAADDATRAFVRASLREARRRRVLLWGVLAGIPVGLCAVVGAVVWFAAWRERRDTESMVAAQVGQSRAALDRALALDPEIEARRAEAFARFDVDDGQEGERRWRDAVAMARTQSEHFAASSAAAGLALSRSPRDPGVRALAADVALRWLLAAERDHDADVVRELTARMSALDDDGSRRARLSAPAHLRVATAPPGAAVVLHEVHLDERGYRVEDDGRPIALDAPLELAPGSYVLTASSQGRFTTRLPVRLTRGQDQTVAIAVPAVAEIPPGFVPVPEGWTFFGAPDVEFARSGLTAQPEHRVLVGAFLIAVHETTFGDYFEFLRTLPPDERQARRPHVPSLIESSWNADGTETITLHGVTIRSGQPLCRPKRAQRHCQDWYRLPVAGISWSRAKEYAAWLAATRVPGARLCTEREWERAARGADERSYPWGDALHDGDANYNATYAVDADQEGEDEVGSFPNDRSPFGVLDMAGNMGEWVADNVDATDRVHVARGGRWVDGSFLLRAAYRDSGNIDGGGHGIGLRLCASRPGR